MVKHRIVVGTTQEQHGPAGPGVAAALSGDSWLPITPKHPFSWDESAFKRPIFQPFRPSVQPNNRWGGMGVGISWSVGGGGTPPSWAPRRRGRKKREGVLLLIHPSSEVVGARQFWGWTSPGPTFLQLGGIGVCLVAARPSDPLKSPRSPPQLMPGISRMSHPSAASAPAAEATLQVTHRHRTLGLQGQLLQPEHVPLLIRGVGNGLECERPAVEVFDQLDGHQQR
ncbi:MAG: hypothetical protein CM15mP77_1070 [Synechococcus sp.]|nr:MAG: hypothetical protein CM15mP77_1070 [Synechococcus sp.]